MRKSVDLRIPLIILCLGFLWGCGSARERTFADADLLIEAHNMPEHWAVAEYSATTRDEEGQISGAYISFYYTETAFFVRGGEDIYRYGSISRADRHYRRLEDSVFTPNIRQTVSVVPEGFTFSSITADQWRFACHESTFSPTPEFGNVRTICQFLAQYDEFIVYFTITTQVEDEAMTTIDQVQSIIETIDQKMGRFLTE
jgi:hypothetical protein